MTKNKIAAIKKVKTGFDISEAAVIFGIVYAVFFCLKHGILGLSTAQCDNPLMQMPSDVLDIMGGIAETTNHLCVSAIAIELSWAFIVPYIMICICMIAGRHQTTPVSYFRGLYFTNEKGERPTFRQAATLMLGNVFIFPIILCLLYWQITGAQQSMDSVFNIMYIFIAYSYALGVYRYFSNTPITINERLSGLRIHLTDKTKNKIEQQASKRKTRWLHIVSYYLGLGIHILAAIFFILIAVNILRQGSAPADYEQYLYAREQTQWDDNAYFALTGLDAPVDIENAYLYGKERAIYTARIFSTYKAENNLPHETNIPQIALSLYTPKEADKNEINRLDEQEDWHCLVDMRAQEQTSACPNKSHILDLIPQNKILWDRFLQMAEYKHFSIPDISISTNINGRAIWTLSNIHSVYVLDLIDQNKKEEAVREWQRFMVLYRKMINASGPISDKAVYIGMLKTKLRLLEIMLNHAPDLAVTYKHEITNALNLHGIDKFRASHVIADDWRGIEPLILPALGANQYQRQRLYACFIENKNLATLPALIFFKQDQKTICENALPRFDNFTRHILIEPGNFMTNIIYNLLYGGLDTGVSFVANMHHIVAESKMALVAVNILHDRITPSGIPDYLQKTPTDLYNPITQAPFLWDSENARLYYNDPYYDDLYSSHKFIINTNTFEE